MVLPSCQASQDKISMELQWSDFSTWGIFLFELGIDTHFKLTPSQLSLWYVYHIPPLMLLIDFDNTLLLSFYYEIFIEKIGGKRKIPERITFHNDFYSSIFFTTGLHKFVAPYNSFHSPIVSNLFHLFIFPQLRIETLCVFIAIWT